MSLVSVIILASGNSQRMGQNKLFLKYIKETLLIGVVDLLISICLYFVPDIKNREFASYGFYVWSFMGVSFLLLTYRSLKNMLDIIFMSDNQMISNRYYKSQEQIEDEKRIEKREIIILWRQKL